MAPNPLWQEWLQQQRLWSGDLVRLAGHWAFTLAPPGTWRYQWGYRLATLGAWALLWMPWGILLLWQRWPRRSQRDAYDTLRLRQYRPWLFWWLIGTALALLAWPAPLSGMLPVAWSVGLWVVLAWGL